MAAERPVLTEGQIIAEGGWHPRYARVLAVASDGDFGFALVDGNGDGAELEDEIWLFGAGSWSGGPTSGAGPLSQVGTLRSWWPAKDVCVAYGSAPGRQSVTISLAAQRHDVPVGRYGIWAFVKVVTGAHDCDGPELG
ncbi:MAG: hypothetical protein ACRDOK_14190 [Streptosporangiaceae bacterium]